MHVSRCRDVACNIGSFRQLLARLRSTDVTVVVEEGAFHDLHHDPKTPELLGHMTSWLQARVKG
jgi:alpha-beta hydrolase superfamily lysophospholipase